ncbi:hypothetical protein N825_11930 [Skermanella stibiiresistens SB22]|uniref:DUF4089 domain-containing protein n=1 Tax=Skermanella stibiiresistens SB22 TaxID=1385369 RepID=W9GUC2_9PROT|nr:DUF4089 domain-containing protein [Skermanella stibiiresistens]EWY37384.1 hypothetical protein N825_11930 [Skermanella stibiiresistens SB22]
MPHTTFARNNFHAESHVDLMAAALGLTIAPDDRAGVVANMARTAELAQLVAEFPLDDHVELAPTFRPGEDA